jgi:DNA polymerase-1
MTDTKQQSPKTLVLLDVHAILHRAYHAMPDFASSKGVPTGALYGVCTMLFKTIDELKPDYIVACYDLPEPTFRHEAYDNYKQGRAKAEDDLVQQIERSRDIFEAFHIPMYDAVGFEADDILGTIVEKTKKKKNLRVIIASGDMDTLQLVDNDKVLVYTLKKGINDTVLYDEKAVVKRFGFTPEFLTDYKGLRGDPSDNIIGIKGIGEKTATTLITAFGTIEDIYEKLKKDEASFEKEGIKPRIINLLKEGEEEALFSKTLATIRRDAPIEFEVPKESWSETIDLEKAGRLFEELEFRRMMERLKNTLGMNDEEVSQEKEPQETIDDEEMRRAALALWLINSDLTNPTLEDILAFSHKQTFKESVPILLDELKKRNLEKVYFDIELPLIPILDEANRNGILIDVSHFEILSEKYHKELVVLEKSIWDLAGGEFNINSPKQLGEVLFDKLNLSTKGLKKTAGGARSTRESEIVKLKDEHEIIAEILNYRELQKMLSTYIDTIPHMVEKDGRVHAKLHQSGTTTGRMSSTDPNMQNIPARGDLGVAIRKGFVAEKGSSFIALDYSQVEMRVLAVLSGDEKLIDIFKKGEDVHSAVASYVFDVPEDEVTKDMRRKAKVINFGIIYGMGVNALKENLKTDRKEAQEFYNNYFEKFPTISDYFEEVKAIARKVGYTETLFGRRRYFGGLKSSIPYIRASAERMAMNAPIQGTAADIIKIAMIEAQKNLAKEKMTDDAKIILQIHDELVYEVKDEKIEQVVSVVKKAMEEAVDFAVPLEVHVSVGKSLGEMSKK